MLILQPCVQMLDRQEAAAALGWIMLTCFHPTVTAPRRKPGHSWHSIKARAGPGQVQQLLGSFPDKILAAGINLQAPALLQHLTGP